MFAEVDTVFIAYGLMEVRCALMPQNNRGYTVAQWQWTQQLLAIPGAKTNKIEPQNNLVLAFQ